jgi:hypothetical protein
VSDENQQANSHIVMPHGYNKRHSIIRQKRYIMQSSARRATILKLAASAYEMDLDVMTGEVVVEQTPG